MSDPRHILRRHIRFLNLDNFQLVWGKKYLPEQSSASMMQFRLLIFEPYPADIVQLLQALHSPQTPAELLLSEKH